jgi:hypothetical protein
MKAFTLTFMQPKTKKLSPIVTVLILTLLLLSMWLESVN